LCAVKGTTVEHVIFSCHGENIEHALKQSLEALGKEDPC
jgi:hypothetical protein